MDPLITSLPCLLLLFCSQPRDGYDSPWTHPPPPLSASLPSFCSRQANNRSILVPLRQSRLRLQSRSPYSFLFLLSFPFSFALHTFTLFFLSFWNSQRLSCCMHGGFFFSMRDVPVCLLSLIFGFWSSRAWDWKNKHFITNDWSLITDVQTKTPYSIYGSLSKWFLRYLSLDQLKMESALIFSTLSYAPTKKKGQGH